MGLSRLRRALRVWLRPRKPRVAVKLRSHPHQQVKTISLRSLLAEGVGLSRLRRALRVWLRPGNRAGARGSQTAFSSHQQVKTISLRSLLAEGVGLSRLRRALRVWLRPRNRADARGSQTAFSSHQQVKTISLRSLSGGRGGIRTHGTVSCSLDFESSAFNRTQPPFPLLFKRFCGLLPCELPGARCPLMPSPLGRTYSYSRQRRESRRAISGIESALSPLQSGCAMSTPKEEEEYRKNEEQWKKIRAMSTQYFGPLQMQHSYI